MQSIDVGARVSIFALCETFLAVATEEQDIILYAVPVDGVHRALHSSITTIDSVVRSLSWVRGPNNADYNNYIVCGGVLGRMLFIKVSLCSQNQGLK